MWMIWMCRMREDEGGQEDVDQDCSDEPSLYESESESECPSPRYVQYCWRSDR